MNVHAVSFRKLREYAALVGTPPPPRRILVVDDEEVVCNFVARVLRAEGYVVETACSGTEALEAVAGGATFDLVISDVRMPAMSGPRFVEHLRRSEPDIKVLYLTGYDEQLFTEREMLWTDESFLEKPCSITGLREAVSLALDGRLTQSPTSATQTAGR